MPDASKVSARAAADENHSLRAYLCSPDGIAVRPEGKNDGALGPLRPRWLALYFIGVYRRLSAFNGGYIAPRFSRVWIPDRVRNEGVSVTSVARLCISFASLASFAAKLYCWIPDQVRNDETLCALCDLCGSPLLFLRVRAPHPRPFSLHRRRERFASSMDAKTGVLRGKAVVLDSGSSPKRRASVARSLFSCGRRKPTRGADCANAPPCTGRLRRRRASSARRCRRHRRCRNARCRR